MGWCVFWCGGVQYPSSVVGLFECFSWLTVRATSLATPPSDVGLHEQQFEGGVDPENGSVTTLHVEEAKAIARKRP
jgi:hypothetical protein